MRGSVSLIGVIGTNRMENDAFIYESDFFSKRGINVPSVLAVSSDGMAYLQEDLGDKTLLDVIREEGESERVKYLCKEALTELVKMQSSTDGFDWNKCFPVVSLDRRSIMWDLNYFKYCFLKPVGIDFDEPRLEDEFVHLASCLENASPRGFMFRDFQSRNIMIKDNKPWFIDFQGGRKGPLIYDAVSFIWQARAGFSEDLKNELFDSYIDQLSEKAPVDYPCKKEIIVFRMLQVLGAYGFRGLIEKKQMFIDSIPGALASCIRYLDRGQYPHLATCLNRANDEFVAKEPAKELTVYVTSFSYKRGIPEDHSGNGGGFVFDCRAIHNPGRYQPYKKLTGDEPSVIEFLERESDIEEFLNHCYALVDASVEVYLRRGFTSLQVNFGCTGGQHRSVYSATHMARHIAEKYGVRVVLTHREQNKQMIYPAKV